MITYTILGAPYYKHADIYPRTLFSLLPLEGSTQPDIPIFYYQTTIKPLGPFSAQVCFLQVLPRRSASRASLVEHLGETLDFHRRIYTYIHTQTYIHAYILTAYLHTYMHACRLTYIHMHLGPCVWITSLQGWMHVHICICPE